MDDGENFILEAVGAQVMSDIDRVSELFETVAVDFSCSVGKVGSTAQSNCDEEVLMLFYGVLMAKFCRAKLTI